MPLLMTIEIQTLEKATMNSIEYFQLIKISIVKVFSMDFVKKIRWPNPNTPLVD